jgi:hypothetical protein
LTLLVALSQFPANKQVHQLLFVPDGFEVKKRIQVSDLREKSFFVSLTNKEEQETLENWGSTVQNRWFYSSMWLNISHKP